MRKACPLLLPCFVLLLSIWILVPAVSAAEWDPISDAEKSMKTNPVDPGSGAVVLFKRGEMEVGRRNASLWETKIVTYTRIKVLTDAGKDAGNVVLETPKYVRVSHIEGRTILPNGDVVPLDTSKVYRSISYQSGRDFALLATSFAFSSVEPGAILEYQVEQFQDWFFPGPWVFDTAELGTLQSSVRVTIGDDLAMAQAPLDTLANKITASKRHTARGDETTYVVQNLRPLRREPYSVPFYDRAVLIHFNPVEWLVSGRVYPVIKTWDDVATQINDNVKQGTKSSGQTTAKAKELITGISDPRERSTSMFSRTLLRPA